MEQENPPPPYKINSTVEVTSSEEGFTGAWFQATVLPSPPSTTTTTTTFKNKKPPKLFVEYKTLFADDILEHPLREHVDVAFVRPLPPIYNNPTLFELYDVVDAFYKDGWWTGVITRIFRGSRFVVTFRDPPDEIEFGAAGLRLHFDWVNDVWVRPRKQKIPGLMFGEGKEVEVLVKIKHNQDVWYPATVVENDADSSFLVEYMTLKEGTNETEHHKVTVDCSHIRPSPPPLKDRVFDLLEKVDALHEFGWWSGIHTKELPDNRYKVFFQSTKREGYFDRTHVRPQLSWRDGKWWFTSSQEEVTPCQIKPGGLVDIDLNDVSSGRTCKSEVILNGEKMEQKSPISSCSRESNPCETLSNRPGTPKGVLGGANLEETDFPPSSLGEENQTDHVLAHEKSHGIASSPKKAKHLEKRLKRGEDAATPSRILSQQNTATSDKQKGGIDSTSGSPPSNILGENMLMDLNGGDQPSGSPSRGMRTPKKQKKIDAKENHTLYHRRKPGEAVEERTNGFTKLAVRVERDSGGKKADRRYIIGLESCKLSNSKAGKTCLNIGEECEKLEGDQKKQLNDLPVQEKGSEAEKSGYKRKRGRPRKGHVGSVNAVMTEQINNTASDAIIIKDSTMSEVDSHVAPDSVSMSTGELLPAENSLTSIGDTMELVCAQLNRRNDSGSTRRKSSRMLNDSNDQALIGENERQIPNEENQMTTTENKISQVSDGDTMVKQSAELRQMPQTRKELNGQITSAKDNIHVAIMSEEVDARTHSVTTTSEPELPFVKSSLLWKVIESMEAFQKMPQKPHFRPLKQYKENSREGYAIACMVSFSSTVENISMLRFDTMKEKVDDILDSLKDLDSHGFGVQVLRDRITELESIKEKHKEHHEEVDVINKQIASCNFDKADQDKEISEVSQHIKKLQERITKAESIKEMKDREIAVLESRRQEAEETIGSARRRYEGLASGVL